MKNSILKFFPNFSPPPAELSMESIKIKSKIDGVESHILLPEPYRTIYSTRDCARKFAKIDHSHADEFIPERLKENENN